MHPGGPCQCGSWFGFRKYGGSGIRFLFDSLIGDLGWVKNQDPDPGWTTRIIFTRAKKNFLGLKYLNSLMRIRDPGWQNFGSRIPDPYIGFSLVSGWQGSALFTCLFCVLSAAPRWKSGRTLAGCGRRILTDGSSGTAGTVRSCAEMEFLNGIFSRDFWA
jgi:hypothetical protein